jgi:hypothetical protein
MKNVLFYRFFIGHDLVRQPLIFGQVSNEFQYFAGVSLRSEPYTQPVATTQCLFHHILFEMRCKVDLNKYMPA